MPDPIEMLRRKAAASTQRQVALEAKVSEPFLSMVLRGKKRPSARLLRYLGLERGVTYRKRADL